MKLIDQIQSAQSNLLRSKARTVLTILAIVIGTFMLAMTTGLTQGINKYISAQIRAFAQPNAIIVTPNRTTSRGGQFGGAKEVALTQSNVAAVAAIPNVDNAYPAYSVTPTSLTYGSKVDDITGISGIFPGDQLALSTGAQPSATDISALYLPYTTLSAFGFSNPQDAIGKTVRVLVQTEPTDPTVAVKSFTVTLTIKGVLLNSIASESPYVSYQLIQQLAQFQSGSAATFSAIIAEIKPGLSAAAVTNVKNAIEAKNLSAITYADEISAQQQAIDLVTIFLDGFAGIALLVATIGIVNTLLMAVLERTQEIGLLKALGLKRREIFSLFAFEAISLGFWGGLVGIGLGLAAGPVVNLYIAHKQNGNGFSMVFPPEYMASIVIGAMLVGFLAGVLPAIRASRLDPIEALRRE